MLDLDLLPLTQDPVAEPVEIPVRLDISDEKYKSVKWTHDEQLFRHRRTNRNKPLSEIPVPFSEALWVKLRRSLFGTFVKFMNVRQNQNMFLNENKECIMDTMIKEFTPVQVIKYELNNNWYDQVIDLLKKAIKSTEVIDWDFLYENLQFLRLDDYNINELDDGLRKLKSLKELALCDNWLQNLDVKCLPRRLRFLELFANDFSTLEWLGSDAKLPKNILHLGLGRNGLTNDSSLHLLGGHGHFNKLRTLDLSDCDIYDLEGALESLETLPQLESLILAGNPCSMVMAYKDMVLSHFPRLIFLDEVEIPWKLRKAPENYLDYAHRAELRFTCSKITGLIAPPKEKKVKQTIHLEFRMPLLQEHAHDEILPEEPKEEKKGGKGKKGGKDKKSKKSKSSKKSSAKSKKGKGKKGGKQKNPYEEKDEHNPRLLIADLTTDRKKWNKTLKFPPTYISSPENNLFAFRDTFRSVVNVRVVYLKWEPPKKEKKKKGKKEKKKKDKKDKKSKKDKSKKSSDKKGKGKKSNKTTTTTESTEPPPPPPTPPPPPPPPKETIFKRVTLAEFQVDLTAVDWKDDGLDFYWSQHPKMSTKGLHREDYLKQIKSEEKIIPPKKEKAGKEKDKKGKKGKKDKGKDKKSSKKSKSKKGKKDKKGKKGKKEKVSEGIIVQVNFNMKRL